MNTPTHLLTAAALLMRRDAPARNTAVVVGALLPDLSIFVLFGWARLIQGVPEREIWRSLYWQEPWQTVGAIANSFPVWVLVLMVAACLGWRVFAALAGAALVHLMLDFPVHADDAHRHFWPLIDWRFHSPLSYWDGRYNARWVMAAEVVLVIACVAILWRRFENGVTRGLLVLTGISLCAAPIYFWLALG